MIGLIDPYFLLENSPSVLPFLWNGMNGQTYCMLTFITFLLTQQALVRTNN